MTSYIARPCETDARWVSGHGSPRSNPGNYRMTVAFPMLIYLTALGLGGFCRPLSGRGWPGLRWYLGFLLIPLLLLVINVALRIPIIPASRVVGLCAVAGLVFELRMSRTGPEPLFRWTHPVVVFPLVYLALSSGFGHRGYVASQFDEFTHWLLMPRQILLAGRPASHAIPFKSYADYTPGWSFLLLYPFAVLGAPFDTGPLLWVPFLSSVGLLAATFDVLCQLDSSERPSATLTAWAVILFLAPLHAGACLSPTEVLIEPPLEN